MKLTIKQTTTFATDVRVELYANEAMRICWFKKATKQPKPTVEICLLIKYGKSFPNASQDQDYKIWSNMIDLCWSETEKTIAESYPNTLSVGITKKYPFLHPKCCLGGVMAFDSKSGKWKALSNCKVKELEDWQVESDIRFGHCVII